MKLNVTSKFKIWLVITLALLVVGMAILGIFGINKTIEYKKHYELSIGVDIDADGASETIKSATENYLKEKNIKFSSKKAETVVGTISKSYIYTFKNDVEINKDELTNSLQDVLEEKGYELVSANVSYSEVAGMSNEFKIGFVILALGISAILLFAYALIFEKLASALTTFGISVGTTVLAIAFIAITRIPIAHYMGVFISIAFILSAVLSIVMVNRFKEISGIVGNEKLSLDNIANAGANQSLIRFLFVLASMILASIFVAAFGMIFEGLALLCVSIITSLSVFVWTPILWKTVKGLLK